MFILIASIVNPKNEMKRSKVLYLISRELQVTELRERRLWRVLMNLMQERERKRKRGIEAIVVLILKVCTRLVLGETLLMIPYYVQSGYRVRLM